MKVIKTAMNRAYVLQTADGYILIDTAYSHKERAFFKQLDTLGVRLSQITHVIFTHHHSDHVGLAAACVDRHPRIKTVFAKAAERPLREGQHAQGMRPINRRVQALMRAMHWTMPQVEAFPALKKREGLDIAIDKDMWLRDVGIPLEGRLLLTPGHTADSLSVVMASGTCFCGDAASNAFHALGVGYASLVAEDWDAFYRSWEKLVAAGACTLYPGHGKPFGIEKLKVMQKKQP